jgi:hypothetical protein
VNDFDLFWAAYPRRVAKKAALRAWAKLKPSPDLVFVILADVERRKESEQWCKCGGQFVPHASTYLNGARWEDEDLAAQWADLQKRQLHEGLRAFVERGE